MLIKDLIVLYNMLETQNNEQFAEIYQVLQNLLSSPEKKSRTEIDYKK